MRVVFFGLGIALSLWAFLALLGGLLGASFGLGWLFGHGN